MSSFASTSASTIEAQLPQTPLSGLPPVAVHTPTTTASSPRTIHMRDPLDEFFGYTFSASSTHESRHDSRPRSTVSDVEALPAYEEASAIPLPEYTRVAPEPVTLAEYLFKFGFLFFPFWIFGAFILMSPLREPYSPDADSATPAWMPEKTEAEKEEIIKSIRVVELKWAKRCLCAFVVFAILAAAAGVAAWAVLKH